MERRIFLLTFALAVATTALAQPAVRRATNIAALMAFSGFYHQRAVLVVGKVAADSNGELRVHDEAGSIRVVARSSAPEGLDEIRGEFWDLGQMEPDEPRLAGLDLRATFHLDPAGPWPKAGEAIAIIATSVTPASPPPAPTIRSIVLNPTRYLDQKVTVTGQFAGRNLFGDLPDAPGRSRYDFVLRSVDAAIWVTNIRPRGKDFDLALDARSDTGRWLQVTGTVRRGRGLQWIDAEPDTLTLAKPAAEPLDTEPPTRVPAGPPPEVVFSAPTQDEMDVSPTSTVRIQLSRDLDPTTLKGHVRVSYLDSQTAERGEGVTQAVEFTLQYNAASRVLEIRFTAPLERFRTLNVELLDGILGTDKQPLKPWTLTFALGGS